ncbi:MAG: STAS domain-containing protein [Marmoricola sp.]
MKLDIQVARDGARAEVALVGELDMLNAPDVTDRLTGLLDDGVTDLAVNLTGLEFIDSSGLSALIGVHQDAEPRGATLTLVSPHERVVRLLHVTGLGDVFEVSTTAPTEGDDEVPQAG